jgi:ADP-ribose pyrophosphatase
MRPGPKHPELPQIEFETLEDLTPETEPGFLRLRRRRYRLRYPDDSLSKPFLYDEVERAAIDAVVIVAHFLDGDEPFVYLRSALRPPIFSRSPESGPLHAGPCPGGLWELPAGLVEVTEQTLGGARRTAQRELLEELGFHATLERLTPLGPVTFPAPGFIAEQHFYFAIRVHPNDRTEPTLDGSPLEHFGKVVAIPLKDALLMCRDGSIRDAKTELGLRRLLDEEP